ncbi:MULTISPECIES: sulfotransferase family protein [Sphingomonas]|uniref:Sulfotransferase n=1 Tax=Sphingomonas lycopersici TaxID=2951807 RepID=A0AA41ZDX3_9SPHN|nr:MULTISPECIES: sulfotransferase [unclassified Sphingomonas]MCW6534821.1 sulfotransferase [Sphingomonas lycopersici]
MGQERVPDREALVAEARAQTGLGDFGNTWFFANIDALIPSLNNDAQLSPAGVAVAKGMIVNGLVNRLRHVELLKQHPEILDEKVEVAAVVVGLPRTGSTMLHRMLAAAPGMTGVRWFEAQNYSPFPGEERGNPAQRRAAAQGLLDYMVANIPDLMSIHPMSLDQPDEELIVLGQLYSSTMIEGTYHVPGFAHWLTAPETDRTQCYRDLKQILQSLQWQDPSRKGARWVLKTPGHLMALDAVIEVFPEAKIVMTHRDPVATVPSYCSMEYSLYQMVSETIDRESVARFWVPRLAELLDGFMRVRRETGGRNFVDVRYADLLSDPIGQGARVLEAAGVDVTPEVRAGMEQWVEHNKREDRAPHKYSLEDFGLNKAEVERPFADYRAKFLAA